MLYVRIYGSSVLVFAENLVSFKPTAEVAYSLYIVIRRNVSVTEDVW